MKKAQNGSRGRPDFLLLILTLLLVGFGLVMVFSASSSIAVSSSTYNNDALYFTKRQMVFAALGIFAMLFMMNFKHIFYKKAFILLFIPVIIALFLVPFLGTERNGATSWFEIGSFTFQPTEPAKLALILYLGALIAKKGEKFRDFKKGLLPVIVIIGFVCGLIMMQPDLGSTFVIAVASFIMLLAGGANLKQLSMTGIVALIFVALAASIQFMSDPTKWEYRIHRFTSYMDPIADQQATGYQLVESLKALGHGGISGAGFGEGVQKLHYLPFAYNDFIFAVIGEEFGFIGSALFLLVFLVFLWRGLIIALRSPDAYGTIVGVGIVGLLAVQAFVNIGGVIGAIPITGVTLPFVSYGGSSLLFTLMSMGVLLSISRSAAQLEKLGK